MSMYLFNRLETLDFLIRTKSTGKPAALSSRLGISERSLYDFLDLMRSLGAPIAYSKTNTTYYYEEKGYFFVRFQKQKESHQEGASMMSKAPGQVQLDR